MSLTSLQDELKKATGSQYLLQKVIGQGSYGLVLQAVDESTGEVVALKRIHEDILKEDDLSLRVLREIKLLKHFKVKTILSLKSLVLAYPKANSHRFKSIFMVTELMETDLKALLNSGQNLPEPHVCYMMFQLMKGLHFMHQAGVIHRDITPSNILINTKNCDLRIGDLGLSREIPDFDSGKITDYVTVRWYRAPEVLVNAPFYGCAIDIWAAGCVFAELLKSKPLFPGLTTYDQIERICDLIPPDAETLNNLGVTSQRIKEIAAASREKNGASGKLLSRIQSPASEQALDLLGKLLRFNPTTRLSSEEALYHPFIAERHAESAPLPKIGKFRLGVPTDASSDEVRSEITKIHRVMSSGAALHCKKAAYAGALVALGASLFSRIVVSEIALMLHCSFNASEGKGRSRVTVQRFVDGIVPRRILGDVLPNPHYHVTISSDTQWAEVSHAVSQFAIAELQNTDNTSKPGSRYIPHLQIGSHTGGTPGATPPTSGHRRFQHSHSKSVDCISSVLSARSPEIDSGRTTNFQRSGGISTNDSFNCSAPTTPPRQGAHSRMNSSLPPITSFHTPRSQGSQQVAASSLSGGMSTRERPTPLGMNLINDDDVGYSSDDEENWVEAPHPPRKSAVPPMFPRDPSAGGVSVVRTPKKSHQRSLSEYVDPNPPSTKAINFGRRHSDSLVDVRGIEHGSGSAQTPRGVKQSPQAALRKVKYTEDGIGRVTQPVLSHAAKVAAANEQRRERAMTAGCVSQIADVALHRVRNDPPSPRSASLLDEAPQPLEFFCAVTGGKVTLGLSSTGLGMTYIFKNRAPALVRKAIFNQQTNRVTFPTLKRAVTLPTQQGDLVMALHKIATIAGVQMSGFPVWSQRATQRFGNPVVSVVCSKSMSQNYPDMGSPLVDSHTKSVVLKCYICWSMLPTVRAEVSPRIQKPIFYTASPSSSQPRRVQPQQQSLQRPSSSSELVAYDDKVKKTGPPPPPLLAPAANRPVKTGNRMTRVKKRTSQPVVHGPYDDDTIEEIEECEEEEEDDDDDEDKIKCKCCTVS
eukprot:TRINITY_DN1879_c0_g1_i1.p1 TRINITY_DN1879_c0_g1~~TRINITY_DN1879_c0_g1_i1.p1  ORF type:complete len:1038 (+),score=148.42 TRINITY_DN1879_c0_g1_i1:89-3202(+)